MSPDQVRSAETVDARADVWSLGVLLYECLSGSRPFPATNYNALLLSIVSAPHRPLLQVTPELDPELCELVENCLIKDREVRTQSARDVAEQLERVALKIEARSATRRPASVRGAVLPKSLTRPNPRPTPETAGMPARVLPLGVRMWQFIGRKGMPRGILAGGSAALGIALGLGVGLFRNPDPPPPTSTTTTLTPITLTLPAAAANSVARAPTTAECAPVETAPKPSSPAAKDRPNDLVTAAARSLGITPAAKPKPQLAVTPRSRKVSSSARPPSERRWPVRPAARPSGDPRQLLADGRPARPRSY
jgi:serine/threonine protein kinase